MSQIFFYFSWYNWKHQNKWVPVGFVVDAKVFCLQIQIWNTAANVSAFYNKYLKGSEQDLVRYYRYVLPVLPFNSAACILLSSSFWETKINNAKIRIKSSHYLFNLPWEWFHDDTETSAFNINIRLLMIQLIFIRLGFVVPRIIKVSVI